MRRKPEFSPAGAHRPRAPFLLRLLLGVAIGVATVSAYHVLERPRPIAGVRLDDLAAIQRGAPRGTAPAATPAADGVVDPALKRALERVAQRHGVVLLATRGILVGAPDLTAEVAAELAEILGAAPSGSTPPPADR